MAITRHLQDSLRLPCQARQPFRSGHAAPPTQRYKIFKIKYADVFDVYLNLKEYFEDELKGDKEVIARIPGAEHGAVEVRPVYVDPNADGAAS